MPIKIKLFAILRERAKCDETSITYRPGMLVNDALAELVATGVLPKDLIEQPFACAVNQEYAERISALKDGDVLALIPPVSGG